MTTFNRRQLLGSAAATVGVAMLGLNARAATQFDQARIIVGFAAGGTTDAIARRLADSMSGSYAKTVIVENRSGAATRIGIEAVKNAAPDGGTVLISPAGMMYIYPHIYSQLSYDPFTDFAPVSTIATTGFALAVGPAVPEAVTNIAQFADWCRAHPKQATYGSPAAGSVPHLMIEAMRQRLNLELVHTGYRGAAPAVLDLLGGQIPAVTSGMGDFLPYLQSDKKIRILATAGRQRTRFTPDVPTFIEQGLEDFAFTEDYSMFAPAGTPPDKIALLTQEIRSALATQPVRDTLNQFGLEPRASTPEELGGMVKSEYAYWQPIIQSIGFKAD